MAVNKHNQSIIEDCIAYFNQEGIQAHEDDGSVYITIEGLDDVQISTAEVSYRAEIFQHRQNILEESNS